MQNSHQYFLPDPRDRGHGEHIKSESRSLSEQITMSHMIDVTVLTPPKKSMFVRKTEEFKTFSEDFPVTAGGTEEERVVLEGVA